jgi:hypothetical protein
LGYCIFVSKACVGLRAETSGNMSSLEVVDVEAQIRTRAKQILTPATWIGFFEWVVWSAIHNVRVLLLFGSHVNDIRRIFAPHLPAETEGTCRACVVRNNGGRWLSSVAKSGAILPEANHFVIAKAIPNDSQTPAVRMTESSCARRAARQAGWILAETNATGDCGIDVMSHHLGYPRTPAIWASIRGEISDAMEYLASMAPLDRARIQIRVGTSFFVLQSHGVDQRAGGDFGAGRVASLQRNREILICPSMVLRVGGPGLSSGSPRRQGGRKESSADRIRIHGFGGQATWQHTFRACQEFVASAQGGSDDRHTLGGMGAPSRSPVALADLAAASARGSSSQASLSCSAAAVGAHAGACSRSSSSSAASPPEPSFSAAVAEVEPSSITEGVSSSTSGARPPPLPPPDDDQPLKLVVGPKPFVEWLRALSPAALAKAASSYTEFQAAQERWRLEHKAHSKAVAKQQPRRRHVGTKVAFALTTGLAFKGWQAGPGQTSKAPLRDYLLVIRQYGGQLPPKKDRAWLARCVKLANNEDLLQGIRVAKRSAETKPGYGLGPREGPRSPGRFSRLVCHTVGLGRASRQWSAAQQWGTASDPSSRSPSRSMSTSTPYVPRSSVQVCLDPGVSLGLVRGHSPLRMLYHESKVCVDEGSGYCRDGLGSIKEGGCLRPHAEARPSLVASLEA